MCAGVVAQLARLSAEYALNGGQHGAELHQSSEYNALRRPKALVDELELCQLVLSQLLDRNIAEDLKRRAGENY